MKTACSSTAALCLYRYGGHDNNNIRRQSTCHCGCKQRPWNGGERGCRCGVPHRTCSSIRCRIRCRGIDQYECGCRSSTNETTRGGSYCGSKSKRSGSSGDGVEGCWHTNQHVRCCCSPDAKKTTKGRCH